jgi:cation transport regulator ChaB
MPGSKDMPSTVARSSRKAQDTWVKTHDSAVEQYGEGRRAHQTAYAALKHTFEKVGDHWERKAGGAKGPSDAQAATPRSVRRASQSGVDANASKQHLLEIARRLDIRGRSSMTKDQLVAAIKKANTAATSRARKG